MLTPIGWPFVWPVGRHVGHGWLECWSMLAGQDFPVWLGRWYGMVGRSDPVGYVHTYVTSWARFPGRLVPVGWNGGPGWLVGWTMFLFDLTVGHVSFAC